MINRSLPHTSENWLDKLVRFANPVKGAARFKARQYWAMATSYTGASRQTRSLSSYIPSSGDADYDTLRDLPLLRQRSRDLLRNNPLALGAINTVCTNVVGTGLKLQSRVDRDFLQLSDEEADALESTIEREFRCWSQSTGCDVTQTLNFAGLQALVFRATLENGDCFIALRAQPKHFHPYVLALQVIEADCISNPQYASDTPHCSGGVEKNSLGAPTAYHVRQSHPGNGYAHPAWIQVPAWNNVTGGRQMIHLYRVLRSGQTRGIPYLAPVIESLKQLGRYSESEIMAAVVSSYFTVFVKTPHGESPLPPMGKNPRSNDEYQLGSGAIVDLAQGEDISTVNPGRPNAQFDPFVQSILRQIGVALELPFEVLIKHFTASYSAARAALLEAWRFFMAQRAWLAQNFCQVVYEAWLLEAVKSGRIDAPQFLDGDPSIRAAYCGSHWIGPAQGQIDPLKEIQAARERIDAGISTLSRETAALTGEEWEKIHRQGVKERRLREEPLSTTQES